MQNHWHFYNPNTFHFCLPIKGIIVKKSYRVMDLSQIVALVMVNKPMQFCTIFFSTFDVIAKVTVSHNNVNHDTRVMPKPWLFSLNNSRANMRSYSSIWGTCNGLNEKTCTHQRGPGWRSAGVQQGKLSSHWSPTSVAGPLQNNRNHLCYNTSWFKIQELNSNIKLIPTFVSFSCVPK